MNQWYFTEAGEQRGPVAEQEIQALLASNRIGTDALVWREGMADWQPISTLSNFHVSPYAPPASQAASEVDWSGYAPSGSQIRPWVRYWARTFDFLLFAMVAGGVLAVMWPAYEEMNDTLLGVLLLLAYNFVEALLLSTVGTTPFKALMRVRVRKNDGTRPSYGKALGRTFSVWLRGQGMGIGLIMLITSITSYNRLKNKHITSWDEDGGFTVSHQEVQWWRWLLLFSTIVGFVALIVIGKQV